MIRFAWKALTILLLGAIGSALVLSLVGILVGLVAPLVAVVLR